LKVISKKKNSFLGDVGMAMEFGNLMQSLTEKKVEKILSSLTE
jgi:hypothetical protein